MGVFTAGSIKCALSDFQFGWLQMSLGSRWSKYLKTCEEAEPESPQQEEAGSEATKQLCSSRYSCADYLSWCFLFGLALSSHSSFMRKFQFIATGLIITLTIQLCHRLTF